MKNQLLLSAVFVCALPALALALALPAHAQNVQLTNGLPFPLVSPADAEKAAVKTPIQLKFDNVSLGQALEELQKQGGVELDYSRESSKEMLEKTLSLDFETRSFNRAFDEIMDEAGVKASLQRTDSDGPWRVVFGSNASVENALQVEDGLFRVRLTTLNTILSKTVRLAKTEGDGRSEENRLYVSLNLLPDLRLPLVGSPRVRLARAEDEKGRSLQLPDDDNQNSFRHSYYSFYSRNYGRPGQNLTLKAPEKEARFLAHLEGVAIYSLISKTESWEIPNLLSEKEWTRQFVTGEQQFDVTLKPTDKTDLPMRGGVAVNVEVKAKLSTIDGQVGHPLMSRDALANAMKIVDANGVVLRANSGGGSTNNQKITVSMTFYPPNAYQRQATEKIALPLKFILEAPLEVVQTEVPFSFSDVPLP